MSQHWLTRTWCEGSKIGGDMAGNFDVVDRQGYRTGEYGLWNVAPVPK